MREIKFRGQRVDNKECIYGFLVETLDIENKDALPPFNIKPYIFKTWNDSVLNFSGNGGVCEVNHESIWAEKSEFSPYQENGVPNEGMKPIYNWVLANAILYEEPILNVKGKLSFWEFEN
ncbi:hypothetical protein [Chryseobacterium aquaticum]|uniref:Uncharacterized protein n=1 Tax=Chryseobacterium aquaticum subsp. greenlandense TaxID=345663 RepID=A0A124F304_9FLAO|nr:hypothetical protein [Chryseobacterium aquaticum]KUJ56441.1 hypothetical protein AR686_07720 [Chryseobacterium aquaticum subsp. greenlandense]